jgi:molecular chaperone DnaK
MVQDAERHAEEDKQRREAVETKNMAENIVYQTEKMLAEHGDKVDAAKKATVEGAIDHLRRPWRATTRTEIKSKMDALNQAMQAVSQEMYAQAQSQGARLAVLMRLRRQQTRSRRRKNPRTRMA